MVGVSSTRRPETKVSIADRGRRASCVMVGVPPAALTQTPRRVRGPPSEPSTPAQVHAPSMSRISARAFASGRYSASAMAWRRRAGALTPHLEIRYRKRGKLTGVS